MRIDLKALRGSFLGFFLVFLRQGALIRTQSVHKRGMALPCTRQAFPLHSLLTPFLCHPIHGKIHSGEWNWSRFFTALPLCAARHRLTFIGLQIAMEEIRAHCFPGSLPTVLSGRRCIWLSIILP